MKKITSIALALALFTTTVLMLPGRSGGDFSEILASDRTFADDNFEGAQTDVPIINIDEVLTGHAEREGFIVAPTMFSQTGIDALSSFVLRVPEGRGLPDVSIDGLLEDEIEIMSKDERTFLITPSIPLTHNNVYVVRLTDTNAGQLTWAFQTAVRFGIISTSPRNQATNVPVYTGIEIAFSTGENIDISENFSIYPHVDGEFLYRGSSSIFAPKSPLAFGQIYTVTLSSGVSLQNSMETIPQNVTFSFETEGEATTRERREHAWSVHFHAPIVEFPTFSNPVAFFFLSSNGRSARPNLQISTYHIADEYQTIQAANRLADIQWWSNFNRENHFIETSNLTNIDVSHPRIDDESEWWASGNFELPINLPPGFYVMEATLGDARDQMIIQITDMAVQVIADDSRAIIWANNMSNGQPISNATVYDPLTQMTTQTSEYGVAVLERALNSGEYLIIRAQNGDSHVFFVHSGAFQWFHSGEPGGIARHMIDAEISWQPSFMPRMSVHSANNQYWTALHLDRTLFQRSDTLSLWGFAQNRRRTENITYVTAVLTENSWHRWDTHENDTLHIQNIPVVNGVYSAEIGLPNLSPGFYEVAIYHNGIVLSSTFFHVMDYVTPAYRLTISSDKAAIFAGETVNFTMRTEFFEGTPVPELQISYSMWGWQLNAPQGRQSITDLDGTVKTSASPTPNTADAQGEQTLSFTAEATLPEIGWTFVEQPVRVFINDIHVSPTASREGENATLTIDVHDITLDRINGNTATHWGDFLDNPTTDQRLNVEIVEVYWVRVRDGQRYNHATREVVPWYRHERRERQITRFDLTTDQNGHATHDFTVPDRENTSYIARVRTTDGNNRTMSFDTFIGRDWSSFFANANEDTLFLYGANEDGYDIGDAIELTVRRNAETVESGNFMFVVVSDGILSYHIGRNPLHLTFSERMMPNVQVFAWHFNGHTYTQGGAMAQRLHFNPRNNRLNIEIEADRESYRPRDTATITIRVTDLSGRPKAANVNLSIVDEALFSLMDQNIDTLSMLFGRMSDNLRFSLSSHRTFISDGFDFQSAQADSMLYRGTAAGGAAMVAESQAFSDDAAGGGSTQQSIRERFEDTAVFVSGRTSASGVTTFTFTLPDNITSWRATASAISDELYAGNAVENIRVSLPMFVHYTLNDIFLVGDQPYLGVNAYGTSFSGGETVIFEVWREEIPNDVRRAEGAAFERVNIPLWEKDAERHGAIIIRAIALGLSDTLRHEYQVVNSHRQIDSAIFYEAITPGTNFSINPSGLTNITFLDSGRGKFLNDLFSLRHTWRTGARIEGLISNREATRLIRAHFPDVRIFGEQGDFDVAAYQQANGGIAPLPHSGDEIETTVHLIPFILNDVNQIALRSYLRNIAQSSQTDNRVLALYGLALMGDSVLLDLQQYEALIETTGLSERNIAYLALGFAALGDIYTARNIYNSHIIPNMQSIGQLYRINASNNREQNAEATSIAALLAAKLDASEAVGLHNYAMQNYRAEPLMNILRLNFINIAIGNHSASAASITYTLFGETITRELGHGGSFSLRIPAQNMNQFNLTGITGDVSAVSIVRVPISETQSVDTSLTISREFFRAGNSQPQTEFEQGDLVRVQITIDYSATSLRGAYIITDFLPSGLKPVPDSARASQSGAAGYHVHVTSEGQRVTFFDWNGRFNNRRTYYYYARVISPGTFTAEGVLIQSHDATDYMAVGMDSVLTIRQ